MDFKAMCIQQGYVPPTCTMEGQYCWMLVNKQGDPCKGCNENRSICNGRYKKSSDDNFLMWHERLEENRRRRQEIIQQRKNRHMNGYTRTLLEIRWESSRNGGVIEIIIKDIVDEKAYYTSCKYIEDMLSIIKYCYKKYNVEQIHVEENGCGIVFYEEINNLKLNIDVVPLRYTKLKLQ